MHLKSVSTAAILVLCLANLSAHGSTDEFVGPFASWADVKRDYGAVGDGKADDTAAIQRALDDLRTRAKHNVLYFPAGTYRITAGLKTVRKQHTDCMGVAIVGEDPATTTLRWDGPADGTMLQYDAWYSAIRRLTLDGAGKAKVALAYGDAFSTYNETADMVFKDCRTGMRMAVGDGGQAENTVLRCKFLRCSDAGLFTDNFNSMDEWVWDCTFEDCGYGMLNGAGNFHAYQNLFLRSKVMDIGTKNLMVFSFVNNTSIGSRCFMDWQSAFTWGSPCSITGNRIVEPTGDFAIRLGNAGPYFVADNQIRSRLGKTSPELIMTWADQVLIGNRYTIPDAVKADGRFRQLDEQVAPADRIDASAPRMPGAPQNRHRRVIDLPVGASAGQIQQAIDDAAAHAGERPVVHLPAGKYEVSQTIRVPAGCDVQIVGDAAAETGTVLHWAGGAKQPVFDLAGPTRASFHDLSIAAGEGVAVRAADCDQPGSSVFGRELNVSGSSPNSKGDAGLLVDGLRNTDVLMHCLQGGTWQKNWVRVIGPAGGTTDGGAPKPAGPTVRVFCGATGTSDAPYAVRQGGRLVVRSVYHEMSGRQPQALLLDNSGSLAIDATRFSYATRADNPLILLDSFAGDLTLSACMLLPVDSEHSASVRVAGDGSRTRALLAVDQFIEHKLDVSSDTVWHNDAKPAARAAMLLGNMNFVVSEKDIEKHHSGYGALDNRGEADDAFLRRMLAPVREADTREPADVPAGSTDLRFDRVIVSNGDGGTGVELHGK